MSQQQYPDHHNGGSLLVTASTGLDGEPDGDFGQNGESNLLREWHYPPVAPAVMVGEASSSSSGNGNSDGTARSPSVVATVVRAFVRTSIDHIYNGAHPDPHDAETVRIQHTELNPQAGSSDETTAGNMTVLSIRSEPDSAGVNIAQQEHHATARSVGDRMDEEAEYILVDGDLIALPPRRNAASGEEGMGDNNNSHSLEHHKPCRPGRMRRGVRKLGKWFGRNKKKHDKSTVSDESPVLNAAADTLISSGASSLLRPSQDPAVTGFANPGVIERQGLGCESSARGAVTGGRHQRNKLRGSQGRRRLRQEIQEQMMDHQEMRQTQQRAIVEPANPGLDSAPLDGDQQAPLAATYPPQPPWVPIGETSPSLRRTVQAFPLGTEDQVHQDDRALPPAAAVVVEYDHFFDDGKVSKGDIPASMVPIDADMKVDKGEAPDVQAMLVRAEHETTTDLETHELDGPCPMRRGKADGSAVPLSQARRTDKNVHNDMLKVLLVGSVGPAKSALARAIRESTKKPRKRTTLGLDVHTWSASDVNFQIWDVQGSTNAGFNENVPNFGAHPGTQSLFFSPKALYLLVWDLAYHNSHALPVFDYDSDEEDAAANDFVREQIIAEADRALQEDIASRVMSWVERIARRAPGSAIIPVAIIPDGMESKEVQRRCSKMFEMLENYVKWKGDSESIPNIVLDDSRNILSVNYSKSYGIKQIQETMVAVATDTSSSVFEHVGTPVPAGTVEILEYTRSVKQHHKLIRLDHILGAVGDSVSLDQAIPALNFLASVGEVLYFGAEQDDLLSSFVILSRQWLVSALSCILRNDLKRELADARRFMNMQCIYSEQKFQENEIIKTLGGSNATSCPLLSNEDAAMLWHSMSFMREAADRYSQINENSTSAPTMFYFLERLLVHFGIFIPFGIINQSDSAGLDNPNSTIFFVPSLLSQADPGDIWQYRAPESWTTTLCHSWLLRDGAPSDLFEYVAVAVLHDLYLFSRKFPTAPTEDFNTRAQSTPLGRASRHELVEKHYLQSIGPVRIHQIICWKSAILLKIGTVFPDRESGELRESLVEVFVTIVDQNSSHCVASDAMRVNMQRVIVSGKGQSGLAGLKLFKGGYQAVLDSVQASLAAFNNVNMQVVCPECLARGNPRRASTWSWDEVLAAAEERSESSIVCRRGHRVKSNLLCGTCKEEPLHVSYDTGVAAKSVPEILPSVVLIGLWDPNMKQIRSVGSGFVADKKFGLIVTAGHVLFNMEEGRHFGLRYLGIPDARVVVGVFLNRDSKNAVWRYFAEVIADDVRNNIDACVLKITSRMQNDVDDEHPGCNQPETLLDATNIKDENLIKLKVEPKIDLGEQVRLLGYSQREGLPHPESRRQILRSPDFAKGYVCRVFAHSMSDDSSSSSDSASKNTFSPREEIVIRCPTIVGHSGGPCVNDDGLVLGILSRADPADPHRCYLVPAGQVKSLVRKARGLCARPVYTTLGVGVDEPESYHPM